MKRRTMPLAAVFWFAAVLSGCATMPPPPSGTYTSVAPFEEYAARHQTVALLPFEALALAKKDKEEGVDGADGEDVATAGEGDETFVEADAEAQAKADQMADELRQWLHKELLKDHREGRLAVAFQDLDETDAKLARHTGGSGPFEIAETLGVDAVLVTRMTFTKLGSLVGSMVGQAVSEALTGGFLTVKMHTDAVAMDASLHDGASGDELWILKDDVSDAALAKALARGLVAELERSFPYRGGGAAAGGAPPPAGSPGVASLPAGDEAARPDNTAAEGDPQ